MYDLRKAEISVGCADIMARFHHLSMPIIKEARWLFATIDRYANYLIVFVVHIILYLRAICGVKLVREPAAKSGSAA